MRTTWGVTAIALMFVVTGASRATTAQAPTAKITVEQHEGYMKAISSANAALGKKITSNELADAAKDAQQIAMVFGDVEKFWAQNNKTDGAMWAQQARQGATDTAAALSAGDGVKAQASRKQMAGSCGACHMAYREGSPQTGGYKIKAGIVTP